MDVVSLLNQSSSSHDQGVSRESSPSSVVGGDSTRPSTTLPTPSPERSLIHRKSEPRQIRGRVPWNADGYSLPLHLETKSRSTSTPSYHSTTERAEVGPAQGSITSHARTESVGSNVSLSRDHRLPDGRSFSSAATTDRNNRSSSLVEDKRPGSLNGECSTDYETSYSPKHKFSDSHSSLSSYSSWQSRSHSRISSVTTISGSQNVGSTRTLVSGQEPKPSEHDRPQRTSVIWRPWNQLPSIRSPGFDDSATSDELRRPRTPSDAAPRLKDFAPHRLNVTNSFLPVNRATHLLPSPKLHKRAISAPNFTPAPSFASSRTPEGFYPPLPPLYRAMASSADKRQEHSNEGVASHQGAHRRPAERGSVASLAGTKMSDRSLSFSSQQLDPRSMRERSSMLADVQELNGSGNEDEEPRCMFVASCDTGSQLRKAISHFFGRNKSCTLKIPKGVWVYYCRKHYQRIRYRNARTYPSNQMELVKLQIARLQQWSESNESVGQGPYIKQWTLSLRKREQNRLENEKGNVQDGDESHVPQWLIDSLGEGYPTEKMLEIAARLHEEIVEGRLGQVPEIEFLPDIVDDEEDGAGKPSRARRQNLSNGGAKAAKRKAVELPGLSRQDSELSATSDHTFARQRSHGIEYRAGMAREDSPSGKRVRVDSIPDASYGQYAELREGRPSAYYTPYGYAIPVRMEDHETTLAPPRAPNVVPQMRPLRYGLEAVQNEESGKLQASSRSCLPHRQHDGDEYGETYDYSGARGAASSASAGAYGLAPSRYVFEGGRLGSVDAQMTLPSIRTQMSGGGFSQQPLTGDQSQVPRFGNHRPSRPMHQRSTSAYTPMIRHVPATLTRPSSSGNGAHVASGRQGHRLPSAGGYDGRPGYQRHDERPQWVMPPPQRSQGHGWAQS